MENKVNIPVNNELDIVIARQKGREMAKEMGFGSVDQAMIATAISELTRNIITYAQNGNLFLEHVKRRDKEGILVISEDNGPGIENVDLAMQDGYSTSKSLGLGLPGVRRLMDDFTIQSKFGKGTTVFATKWIS